MAEVRELCGQEAEGGRTRHHDVTGRLDEIERAGLGAVPDLAPLRAEIKKIRTQMEATPASVLT